LIKAENTYAREGRPSPQQLNSTPGGAGGRVKGFKFFLTFEEARVVVRKLKLGSKKAWAAWSKSGKRSPNIPSNPHQAYRDTGFISYPDWLGYEGRAPGPRKKKKEKKTEPKTGDQKAPCGPKS
jgi:hypothetical protein